MSRAKALLDLIEEKSRMKDLKAKSGDIFEIVEGSNPHRDGEKETVVITVIALDERDGFYYFEGKGKPQRSGRQSVNHSNMFISGIESFKKIGSVQFKTGKYKEFHWTITGIDEVDAQMSNLGDQCQVFYKYAPKWAKDLYAEQEDQNYHTDNGKMVQRFLDWVVSGKKSEDFPQE